MKPGALLVLALAGCVTTPPPPACGQVRALDELNDSFAQVSPWLSADRRELLYASNGTSVNLAIERATRDSPTGTFGAPMVILTEGSATFDPAVSADELTVWYVVGDPQPGGAMWQATRSSKDEPFGGDAAVFPELGNVVHPTLTADQLTIYYAQQQTDSAFHDIWTATRRSTTDPWSNQHAVIAADDLDEDGPSISADGETMLFDLNSTGEPSYIAKATRSHGFADATPATEFDHDSNANDFLGSLHADGRTVVFVSDRSGESDDLFIACE